jgi:tetratricopeptide (TPR) repeat protein
LTRESLAILREIGDRQNEAQILLTLGRIANTRRGDLAEAEQLFRESLAILREIGDRQSEANILLNLGDIFYDGDKEKGDHYYTEAVLILRDIGLPVPQVLVDGGY